MTGKAMLNNFNRGSSIVRKLEAIVEHLPDDIDVRLLIRT